MTTQVALSLPPPIRIRLKHSTAQREGNGMNPSFSQQVRLLCSRVPIHSSTVASLGQASRGHYAHSICAFSCAADPLPRRRARRVLPAHLGLRRRPGRRVRNDDALASAQRRPIARAAQCGARHAYRAVLAAARRDVQSGRRVHHGTGQFSLVMRLAASDRPTVSVPFGAGRGLRLWLSKLTHSRCWRRSTH